MLAGLRWVSFLADDHTRFLFAQSLCSARRCMLLNNRRCSPLSCCFSAYFHIRCSRLHWTKSSHQQHFRNDGHTTAGDFWIAPIYSLHQHLVPNLVCLLESDDFWRHPLHFTLGTNPADTSYSSTHRNESSQLDAADEHALDLLQRLVLLLQLLDQEQQGDKQPHSSIFKSLYWYLVNMNKTQWCIHCTTEHPCLSLIVPVVYKDWHLPCSCGTT